MWQKAKVKEIRPHTDDFRTIVFEPSKFRPFKSGNFVELAMRKNGPYKCYSVVSSPRQKGIIEVGVKLYKNGALSPSLFSIKKGDQVLLRGPMGVYFEWTPSDKTTILIGGGSGICPMVSILRQYVPEKGKLKIVFSTKPDSVYYDEELMRLTREKNVDYKLIKTGKGNRINKKFLANNFGPIIGKSTDFFIAGPTDFVQNINFWLQELGASPLNIKTDDFGAEGA